MPRKRTVGLSAGEAVLGLVIEQPDTASRIGQRLVERFHSAQFTRSTAHNALARLTRQGFIRIAPHEPQPPDDPHYEPTPLGVEHFHAWLCSCSATAPALREELHAKVEFCAPRDLPSLIEAIRIEELACAGMFAAVQGRLSEAELLSVRHPAHAVPWSALTSRVVLLDEAAMWGMRFKRLERLRTHLEELRDSTPACLSEGSEAVAEGEGEGEGEGDGEGGGEREEEGDNRVQPRHRRPSREPQPAGVGEALP
jgi:DNA-binding PadR family transcriptional regulator